MEKEEKQEEISEAVAQNGLEDAVLKFFADSYPEDSESFDSVIGMLRGFGGTPDVGLISAVYKGLKYDSAIEAARDEGYLRGANESIEVEKRRLQPLPVDDGGVEEVAGDLPLLSHIRRSVWEL